MNCDKIGNCDQCPKWFYEGKDFCKSCNFDLNSYNQPEEEEDDDCVECFDCEEVIDRDDSWMVPQSDNNAKLVCVCNSCNEDRKFWDEDEDKREREKESFEEYYERRKDCRCNAWACDACQYRLRLEDQNP